MACGAGRPWQAMRGGRGRRLATTRRCDAGQRCAAVRGGRAAHRCGSCAPRLSLTDVPKICTAKRKLQYRILWKGVKCKASSPFCSSCPSRPHNPMPIPTKESARSSWIRPGFSPFCPQIICFESPFQKIGRNCGDYCALKLLTNLMGMILYHLGPFLRACENSH